MFRGFISEIKLDMLPDKKSYLHDLPVVQSLYSLGGIQFSSPVTVITGENGSGKSTLLEAVAIAAGFNPEGGSKHFNFQTVKAHSELHEYIKIIRRDYPKDGYFLRAESFFNVATNIDDVGVSAFYGGSLHERSHGESFMDLVRNRLRGNGLYIFDEPDAALSPQNVLALLCEIKALADLDSQFIIATHSPIIMAYPGADLLVLGENGFERKNYKDTEHFSVLKTFFDDPERMLKMLGIQE